MTSGTHAHGLARGNRIFDMKGFKVGDKCRMLEAEEEFLAEGIEVEILELNCEGFQGIRVQDLSQYPYHDGIWCTDSDKLEKIND